MAPQCGILSAEEGPREVDAADFRRIALSLPGAEEGSHMGSPDFRVGGRIFATLASQKQGYGNLMLTPEQQAGFVGGLPKLCVPIAVGGGRMGQDGNDPYSAGCGERGRVGRRSAYGMEATDREERKERRKEARSGGARRSNKEHWKETRRSLRLNAFARTHHCWIARVRPSGLCAILGHVATSQPRRSR